MENHFDDTDLSQFYTRRNSNAKNISSVSLVQESQPDLIAEKNAGEIPAMPMQPGVVPGIPPAASGRVVGFLYSVSRSEQGEYWSIAEGENAVGNAGDCPVELNEATVSPRHATVQVELGEKGVKVTVFDCLSACGTFVNGQRVGTDGFGCYHGDIITIGEHYQLLLLIADAQKYQLAPVADFKEGGFGESAADAASAAESDDGTVAVSSEGLLDSESTKFL